jgi:hypothetical protein
MYIFDNQYAKSEVLSFDLVIFSTLSMTCIHVFSATAKLCLGSSWVYLVMNYIPTALRDRLDRKAGSSVKKLQESF